VNLMMRWCIFMNVIQKKEEKSKLFFYLVLILAIVKLVVGIVLTTIPLLNALRLKLIHDTVSLVRYVLNMENLLCKKRYNIGIRNAFKRGNLSVKKNKGHYSLTSTLYEKLFLISLIRKEWNCFYTVLSFLITRNCKANYR